MKVSLFSGLTCDRSDAVSTNCPTQLENLGRLFSAGPKEGLGAAHPAKNALKGKFVTRIQYRNCTIPESMRKTRNESMSFSLFDVLSEYAFHRDSTALAGVDGCCFTAVFWGAIWQIRVEMCAVTLGRGW